MKSILSVICLIPSFLLKVPIFILGGYMVIRYVLIFILANAYIDNLSTTSLGIFSICLTYAILFMLSNRLLLKKLWLAVIYGIIMLVPIIILKTSNFLTFDNIYNMAPEVLTVTEQEFNMALTVATIPFVAAILSLVLAYISLKLKTNEDVDSNDLKNRVEPNISLDS